jgi:hypothetical protein
MFMPRIAALLLVLAFLPACDRKQHERHGHTNACNTPEPEYIAILLSRELHPVWHEFDGIHKVPRGATLYSVLEGVGAFDREIVDFVAFKAHRPFGAIVERNGTSVFQGLIRKTMTKEQLAPFKSFVIQEGDRLHLAPCGDCTIPEESPPRPIPDRWRRASSKKKSSGTPGTIVILLGPRLNPGGAYPGIHRIRKDATLYSVLLGLRAFDKTAHYFSAPPDLSHRPTEWQ